MLVISTFFQIIKTIMIYIKYIASALLIVCLLTNSVQSQDLGDLPETELSSDVLTQFEGKLYMPYRMNLVGDDNFLVVSDISNSPSVHIMEIGDEGDLSYLDGVGREGRGPGEFLSPDDVIPVKGSGSFYVLDAQGRKLVKFNESFEPQSRDEISLELNGVPVSVHSIGEEMMITGITMESWVDVINTDGETIRKIGEPADLGRDLPPHILGYAWHSVSAVNPEDRRIAVFSRSSDVAKMYDYEHETRVAEWENPDFNMPRIDVQDANGNPAPVPADDAKTTFIWATADEDYIYALYSGKPSSDDQSSYGETIVRFDWDLNPVDRLKLDHQAFSILIAPDNTLYSIEMEPAPALRVVSMDN